MRAVFTQNGTTTLNLLQLNRRLLFQCLQIRQLCLQLGFFVQLNWPNTVLNLPSTYHCLILSWLPTVSLSRGNTKT